MLQRPGGVGEVGLSAVQGKKGGGNKQRVGSTDPRVERVRASDGARETQRGGALRFPKPEGNPRTADVRADIGAGEGGERGVGCFFFPKLHEPQRSRRNKKEKRTGLNVPVCLCFRASFFLRVPS